MPHLCLKCLILRALGIGVPKIMCGMCRKLGEGGYNCHFIRKPDINPTNGTSYPRRRKGTRRGQRGHRMEHRETAHKWLKRIIVGRLNYEKA